MSGTDWIRASAAVLQLKRAYGSVEVAASLLEQRAAQGHLSAIAGFRIETRETDAADAVTTYPPEDVPVARIGGVEVMGSPIEPVPRWVWQPYHEGSKSFDWQADSYTAWVVPAPEDRTVGIRRVTLAGIQFRANEIAELVHDAPRPKSNRGRKKGAGGYFTADFRLMPEMHAMLERREAASIHEAAKLLALKAEGGSSDESKAKRLARRYPEWRRLHAP